MSASRSLSAGVRLDSIDAPLYYGGRFARFDGTSARALARRCPGLAQWCAENRTDRIGQLCAEALALWLVGGGAAGAGASNGEGPDGARRTP